MHSRMTIALKSEQLWPMCCRSLDVHENFYQFSRALEKRYARRHSV